MQIKTSTWTRDSHGLFDYESAHVLKKTFNSCHTQYLVRHNTSGEVQIMSESEFENRDAECAALMKATPTGNDFLIESCSSTDIYKDPNDKLWLLIRTLQKDSAVKEEYKLKRGEILKLGRMRIKLKDYRISDAISDQDKNPCEVEEGPVEVKICDDKPKDENDICRICYSGKSDATNPLISACKCTGSMKFIHFKCLKAWIDLHLVMKEVEQVKSYFWKAFECEICKSEYPYCLMHEKNRYSLVDVKKPESGSFVMLESLNHEKNTSRIIHVITPNEAKFVFKLGRGHESDIRVSDISVSRIHALISCTKHGITIEDNMSKFGTLILIRNMQLGLGINKTIQIGRTVISFDVKTKKPKENKSYFFVSA